MNNLRSLSLVPVRKPFDFHSSATAKLNTFFLSVRFTDRPKPFLVRFVVQQPCKQKYPVFTKAGYFCLCGASRVRTVVG